VISGVSRSLCQRSPSAGDPGARVEEGREVVGERRLAGEHHVVAAGAVDFEKSQRGLGEVDAVAALGVAGDLGVRAVAAGDRITAVVAAEAFAVVQHGHVAAEGALPWRIEAQRDIRGVRFVQLERTAVELSDQQIVREQLQARAEGDRFLCL